MSSALRSRHRVRPQGRDVEASELEGWRGGGHSRSIVPQSGTRPTRQSKSLARKGKTLLERREHRIVTTGTIESPRSTLQYPVGAIFLAEQKVIVVIDDDLDILHSLELMLSLCGYHTKLFASAEEFLIAAPTLEASCLIVDIQLGELSGLELVRALCAEGLTLPVIFITGSRDELHRQQAIELGCAAFLLKPFSAERLIDTVRKAIGSKLN